MTHHTFHPAFQCRLDMILGELRSLGCRPKIDPHAFRTSEEEARLVKQGNSKTLKSWHVVSTHALLPHGKTMVDVVYGNAADIVDERYGWGGPAANRQFQFWGDLGRIAKKHGCRWGGDWKRFKDVAHIEFLFIDSAPRSTMTV